MTHLVQRLMDKASARVHVPILDPERPTFSLVNRYHALVNMFEGTGIHVVLHSRVYVSILSLGLKYSCHLDLPLFSALPLPDCNIPGRVLNTLATKILICYVTPSNVFVLVNLVRFEFVTVPLRTRCCITVTG